MSKPKKVRKIYPSNLGIKRAVNLQKHLPISHQHNRTIFTNKTFTETLIAGSLFIFWIKKQHF